MLHFLDSLSLFLKEKEINILKKVTTKSLSCQKTTKVFIQLRTHQNFRICIVASHNATAVLEYYLEFHHWTGSFQDEEVFTELNSLLDRIYSFVSGEYSIHRINKFSHQIKRRHEMGVKKIQLLCLSVVRAG